jgi:pentatricopeptide repeat protein
MANVGLADQILERALQENKASFPVLVVDTIVISSAMNAWVKSIQGNNPTKDQAAAARVEELFHLILAHGLDPDVVAYTLVLQAWAKVGRMDRVDFWWDAMADNDQDIRPTAQTIQALLLAMCNDKNSTVAAVHEAETFLIQLSKNKNEEEEPLVTTLHWNIVLDAHVKLGNLRRAEELLMRLSEATVVSYCTVMNGWARQGNPQRVEAIMERMLDAGISLQTMVYNTLLLAWSRVKSANDNKVEAAKRAMWILQQMQREQQQSTSTTCTTTSTTGPDIITYNTVLQCFATAGMMSEAQELLAEMQQDSIVDIISYNTLLMAFARARQPYKAEALLQHLQGNCLSSNNDIVPNLQSYQAVITAWSMSGSNEAGTRAQALLDELLAFVKGQRTLGVDEQHPTIATYRCVIDCWAKSKQPGLAEIVLRTMPVPPNIFVYTSLMNAYAKVGDAPRAEALLKEVLTKYEQAEGRDETMKPTLATFTTVLDAWAKSKSNQAGQHAQSILVKMQQLYEAGLLETPPDRKSWACVLQCWATTGNVEEAQAVLSRMKADSNLVPGLIEYTAILQAWSRSNHPQAPERAMSFMEEMELKNIRPDRIAFGALIQVWAKSKRKDSGSNAIAALRRLQSQTDNAKRTSQKFQPTAQEYTVTISAFRNDYESVEMLFEEMLELGKSRPQVLPTAITYGTVLQKLAASPLLDKAERADRIHELMNTQGIEVNSFCRKELKKCRRRRE